MTTLKQISMDLDHAGVIMAKGQMALAEMNHRKAPELNRIRNRLNSLIRYLREQNESRSQS